MTLTSNIFSAIDDSGPSFRHGADDQTTQATAGPQVTNERLQTIGPRCGHWTITSSTHGSAIDDGCPAIHNLNPVAEECEAAELRTSRDATRTTRPIPGTLFNKLREATVTARKQREEEQEIIDVKNPLALGAQSLPSFKSASHARELSRFHLPSPLGQQGIRIRGKDGKLSVVCEPRVMPTPEKKRPDQPAPMPEPASAPQEQGVLSAKLPSPISPSIKSSTTMTKTFQIRLRDHNGDEAVIQVPLIPKGARSITSAEEDKAKQSDATKERILQQERAVAAAEELRQMREAHERLEDERSRSSPSVARPMMSRTSPPSRNSKGSSKRHITSSKLAQTQPSKGSGQDWLRQPDDLFCAVSKVPSKASTRSASEASKASSADLFDQTPRVTSKASSKTSTLPSRGTARMVESLHTPKGSAGWSGNRSLRDPGCDSTRAHSLHHDSHRKSQHSKNQEPPTTYVWPAIKTDSIRSGKNNGTEPRPNSLSGSRASSQHDLNATVFTDHYQTPPSPAHNAAQSPVPTIYAGHGWISPHPLSVASSQIDAPPQPAILIPSHNGTPGDGRMLTYQEWSDVRRSMSEVHSEGQESRSRRNGSRTSSRESQIAAGRSARGGGGGRTELNWWSGVSAIEDDKAGRKGNQYHPPTVSEQGQSITKSAHSQGTRRTRSSGTSSHSARRSSESRHHHSKSTRSSLIRSRGDAEDLANDIRWTIDGSVDQEGSRSFTVSADSDRPVGLDPVFNRSTTHLRMPWDPPAPTSERSRDVDGITSGSTKSSRRRDAISLASRAEMDYAEWDGQGW